LTTVALTLNGISAIDGRGNLDDTAETVGDIAMSIQEIEDNRTIS